MIFNLIRGLHIIAVIAWMAGLLYMPRLFVYHTRAGVGSEMDETFKLMEQKLETVIMTPAMIAVLVLAACLVWFYDGVAVFMTPWMMLKAPAAAALVGWHLFLMSSRRRLAAGRHARQRASGPAAAPARRRQPLARRVARD